MNALAYVAIHEVERPSAAEKAGGIFATGWAVRLHRDSEVLKQADNRSTVVVADPSLLKAGRGVRVNLVRDTIGLKAVPVMTRCFSCGSDYAPNRGGWYHAQAECLAAIRAQKEAAA